MRFHKTPLPDSVIIEPEPSEDERGLFARVFDANIFQAHGLPVEFVQASTSYNRRRGTLRGMHFQTGLHRESKLIRCTAGAMFDVIVDVRRNSPTFGQWHAVELSGANRLTLYVPPGYAHGFQTLTDDVEIFYQMTQVFVPEAARGFIWSDPSVAIAWPLVPTLLSSRDRALPPLNSLSPDETV